MKKQLLSLALSSSLMAAISFKTIAQTSCPIVPFAVVELFTSQGCISCPVGDLILSNLINQEKNTGRNVICIAEHVTYWDQLGWVDQYGQTMFGTRQYTYVTTAGVPNKGTPQLFVNGLQNVTGTTTLNNAVNNFLGAGNTASAGVCLNLLSSVNATTLSVSYAVSGNYSGTNLIVSLVEDDLSVVPNAGENAGSTLYHDGVSRNFVITPLTNATGTVTITPPANCIRAKSKIVAYIQTPSTMVIRGATKGIDLSNTSTGIHNNSLEAGLKIYPNPAIDDLFIDYVNTTINSDIEISLIDVSGRLVLSETIASNGNGEFAKNIDVTGFAKGIYILKLKAENEIINKKVIVE